MFRVRRNIVFLLQRRQQFIDDHARIFIVQRIVFFGPIRITIAPILRASVRVDQAGGPD